MNAKPFVVVEPAEDGTGAVPVQVARERMRASIEYFILQALEFHARSWVGNALDFNGPSHCAVRVSTGAGKSEEMRKCAVDFVIKQKRRSHRKYRVVFLVPTHRLAEEASSKMLQVFGARNVSTAIYQSREAKDLRTGEPLCSNLEAVKAAQSMALDVQETCCKKGKVKCAFFDSCAFQLQREQAKSADVVFAAHELMFVTLDRFGKGSFGLVIIDEAFSLKGILQDPRQTRMKLNGLQDALETHPVRERGNRVLVHETAWLRDVSERLQAAFLQMPDGRLTRQGLIHGGFFPSSYIGMQASLPDRRPFAHASRLEYMRKVKVQLRPDTPAEKRVTLAKQHRFLRQILRRARMWDTLEEFLNSDQEIAAQLILETVTENGIPARYLRVLGKKEIHETFTYLPLLHGDATMAIDLVRHHLPRIAPLVTLEVLAPYERITQIVGLSVGKKILALPSDENDPNYAKQQQRRDRLRALVIHLARGRRTLVISQMHVEKVFKDIPNPDTAHFGAIEGLDKYGDVEVLITVGRPMPSPLSIETSGSALTGKPVTVGDRVKRQRPIRLKDGTERLLHCRGYENPDADLLSRSIAEAGVLQALGRSRAVNRTAQNPVEAFVILDDLALPIPVDAVVHVADVEPNEIDEMMARGLVPEWPTDAARLYPDLFKNRKAADYRYRRDGRVPAMFAAASYNENGRTSAASSHSGVGRTSARGKPNGAIDNNTYSAFGLTSMVCRFKPTGRGQHARRALLSPELESQARARIEAALGELALFELVTGHEQPELELVWGPAGSNFQARSAPRDVSASRRTRWRAGMLDGPPECREAQAAA
jgi:hypothetical protein